MKLLSWEDLARLHNEAVRKNKKLLIYVKEPGGRKYIAMGRFIEDDYLTADAITHYPFDWTRYDLGSKNGCENPTTFK